MRFFTFIAALPAVFAVPILQAERAIPGKWIAKLRSDADESAISSTLDSITAALGGAPTHTYNLPGFKGFAMDAPDSLLGTLQALTSLEYIVPDSRVTTNALVSQTAAPWGLARISSRSPGGSTYTFDESAGQGTYSYIIDTGIYPEHNDFGGRAIFGANFAGDNDNTDGNGHGTHVAGTTGGTTYGVAKKTSIIGVKVLGADGSGSISGIIAGIEWAVNDAKSKNAIRRSVGNLSLGGTTNQASNDAVTAAVNEGLFLAVAAGNSGLSASTSSPASAPAVCTVGATDRDDMLASFSNYGSLVDILAPGVEVISAWIDGPDSTNTISGTSMASPHVAGLAAYLIALEGERSPADLCARIKTLSTKGAVSIPFLKDLLDPTDNELAFNGVTA